MSGCSNPSRPKTVVYAEGGQVKMKTAASEREKMIGHAEHGAGI